MLVAYAAADEVVIARGTDLQALKRLRHPSSEELVTALAFRERDAAVAAAFGTEVVVFEGWSTAAKERASVYDSSAIEASLTTAKYGLSQPIVSLSWSAPGNMLCAVANAIVAWSLDPEYLPVRYTVHSTISQDSIRTHPLELAAISPDGRFLAVAGLYARIAYVYILASKHRFGEIVHGRSGIAALDWKKRGGGNMALMTSDRDGTLRIWVRSPTSIADIDKRNPQTWMEEVARCPHAEFTPRAGATFLEWGGGGGVADDEGDARATNATHPLLAEGTAPKPSRCYHWLIRVAGGDATAWRVRGLDDRPRAEFVRLEPGNVETLVGSSEDDDFRPPELPLKGIAVAAMKAVAPIPLTTSSQSKIGLVKSYAVSNGERRLRSPEPPEPPNVVAIFLLAVHHGLPFLARYDICPTSNMPAVCRARVGIGHTSPVVELVTSAQASANVLGSAGWLASRGSSGDVLLWRTNVSTGAWEPMTAIAALTGPHSAVAFAPPRTASHKRWDIGVFSCDSAHGSLRLFQFVNVLNRCDNVSARDVQLARQIALCQPRRSGAVDPVVQLVPMPLGNNPDPVTSLKCAVFGVRTTGRMSVWRVCRKMKDILTMEPSVIRVAGRRHDFVTHAAANELTSVGRQIFATGGRDGSVYAYAVGESELETDMNDTYEIGDSEDEDEDADEGVIWLRQLCHMPSPSEADGPVEKVEILQGGSRILVVYNSGKVVVWSRNATEGFDWQVELTHAETSSQSAELPSNGRNSAELTASIGYDAEGDYSAIVARKDGSFARYKRSLGMPWETIQRNEKVKDSMPPQKHALAHIGKGVVVYSNGRGMSVLAGSKSDTPSLSFRSDAAGFYDPSKSFFALLFTGGRAWQIVAALNELHVFLRNVAKRKASETSYGAGRGVIAPAPSLSMLTSEREDMPKELQSSEEVREAATGANNPFNLAGRTGRSIFAELMAKSEAQFSGSAKEEDNGTESNSSDLSTLANLLRVVSLAGLSRAQQSVLAAVARACASLKTTLTSLDECGARFALMASCYRELSKRDAVPLPCVASAMHSSSSDALVDHFLPPVAPGSRPEKGYTKMWETAKSLGVGWWVSTSSGCQKLAERMARSDFNASKQADAAALWFIVLGKRKALSAFYRAEQNSRMSQFLLRNFDQEENRIAAGKNAYVLVSKHRLELAVAFFVLANNVKGALSLVRTRIKDDQLAIFLARLLSNGEYVQETLNSIIATCEKSGDDHRKALALWLSGKHELALHHASVARYPPPNVKLSEAEKAISGSLPSVVHSLTHVLAVADRPPIRGTRRSRTIVKRCREKAIRALLGDGSPVAALVVSFQVMRTEGIDGENITSKPYSRRNAETTNGSVLSAAVDSLRGRAVCHAGAVRSGATEETLQQLLFKDIFDLRKSPMGLERCVTAVEGATFELVKEDEVDAALIMTYAGMEVVANEEYVDRKLRRRMQAAQRNCLRVAVSRGLFHVQGALSLLHHPTFSSNRLSELLSKYKAAMSRIELGDTSRSEMFNLLCSEFQGAVLSLRFAYAFLKGDWPAIWFALRACEVPWKKKVSLSTDELSGEKEFDDGYSMTSGCSSVSPDSVSLEALRHVASNPAVLTISKSLGHIRRFRKAPSISLVGGSLGVASLTDDTLCTPTLSVRADDPYAVIRMHPALSSTLAAAAAAFLATHLAAHAAFFSKFMLEEGRQKRRSSHEFWRTDAGDRYDQSFRLIKAAETLEQLAEDAISQWVPLQRFGAEASVGSLVQLDESAGAFVDLWSTLGCMPEYAPSLSEAATVSSAEVAAAGAKAAIEAAEEKDGGRRRRRRRERRGEVVASVAKEGLKHFDTTSADSLYGAYPVRFSSSAQGPWSGRGGHASLYSEDRGLFRTLCVSSTDPPAVIVATPKGIQEIVPSSYTTMPAGFRSHYSSKKNAKRSEENDARLEALARDRDQDSREQMEDQDDGFLSSYDGFGEGPYVPLNLSRENDTQKRSKYRSSSDRKAVWRHQVQATVLAAHPLRRRFASGGTDGVVRLWDFADPISLASFREDNFGRISNLCFSAYGNTMLAVYSSGHVTIWDDPDTYSSHPRSKGSSSRAKIVRAFDKRAASGGVFLDERHTIAVVGDPTAPPCVGHSLRIFDTREPHFAFHASWSAAVNHQFEARCLTLLEDRMRVVTGGLDGSLSIVDIRTKACIAELPAHTDEVTCLALEMPRGRALVSGSADGEIKLWDSRTLLQLDVIQDAHKPTRHYWSGNGIGGLVGSYGTQGLALTDRSLISCGGDGIVKIWGPGWSDFDLNVL